MGKVKHQLFWKICTAITSVLLTFCVLELIARGMEPNEVNSTTVYATVPNENLGYVNKPGELIAWKQFSNGTVCYNTTYTIDAAGRRITRSKNNTNRIIFFGDSVTFGEGISDAQTVPYLVSEALPNYTVQNYAVSGWGPNNVLAQFEEGLAQNGSGVALYVMIEAHIHRARGDTIAFWTYASPYYEFQEGHLERKGSFKTGRPVRTKIYQFWNFVKRHSSFVRILHIEFPPRIQEEDVSYTLSMIKQIDTLAAQQNLQFVLVLHPDWGRSASNETKHLLLAQAQLRNLTVLDFSSIPYGANRTLGCDPHPNGELNQEFTHALITALRSDGTLS